MINLNLAKFFTIWITVVCQFQMDNKYTFGIQNGELISVLMLNIIWTFSHCLSPYTAYHTVYTNKTCCGCKNGRGRYCEHCTSTRAKEYYTIIYMGKGPLFNLYISWDGPGDK